MDLPVTRSAGVLHPHVPFDQAPDLALGIAAGYHAADELAMLLLGLAVLLRSEGDDREQVLDLREHALLDHLADLLIARPGGVLAVVIGSGPQGELDDLVAEILRVGDARRLFDLGQFLVQELAIQELTVSGSLKS